MISSLGIGLIIAMRSLDISKLQQLLLSLREENSELTGITWMVLDEQQICFSFINDQGEGKSVRTTFGPSSIAQQFFRHTPPTPDELEYAINTVEDGYEQLFKHIEHSSVLVTADPAIRHICELCGLSGEDPLVLSRERMESLFGQFAEVMLGRFNAFAEDDLSVLRYAQLLVLRECMYHLKFEKIYSMLPIAD